MSYVKCRLFCSSEEEFKMVYHTAVSSCLALIRYSRGVAVDRAGEFRLLVQVKQNVTDT